MLLWLVGAATALLAWVTLSLQSGRQLGWMAVFVALDLAFMLRLGTLRGGPLRIVLVSGGTVLLTALAWWTVASAWFGGGMGLPPLEAALRMGPHLAWTLIGLANSTLDWIWIGVGVAVGAWLGAGRRR